MARRPKETLPDKRRRAAAILRRLKKAYPDAKCALDHSSPLELLVATILSAQSTDKRVNIVTPALFAKYRTAADYARSPRGVLEREIHSTGFFNAKAKSLRAMGAAIAAGHGGVVPDTMKELVVLPGVGRKTANVVLGNAFGKDEGFVVDTHVGRLARRMGLTRQTRSRQGRAGPERNRSERPSDARRASPDLPRTTGLRRPKAPLRRLPGRAAVPQSRRVGGVKRRACLNEISFPEIRRKTLSITLRKWPENREIGGSGSDLHRDLCGRTSPASSAFNPDAQAAVQKARMRKRPADPFSTRASDSESET